MKQPYQDGYIRRTKRRAGPDRWEFLWRETDHSGIRIRRTAIIGTVEQYPEVLAAHRQLAAEFGNQADKVVAEARARSQEQVAEPVPEKMQRVAHEAITFARDRSLVVNTDADQIIIADAGPHPAGGLPPITYIAGGLEDGNIRKAVCDILEGGEVAFLFECLKQRRFLRDAAR